jgi:hypothetical protein
VDRDWFSMRIAPVSFCLYNRIWLVYLGFLMRIERQSDLTILDFGYPDESNGKVGVGLTLQPKMDNK